MPDAISQQIVDALSVIVAALPSVKETGNRNKLWKDVDDTPAAFVVYGGELKTPGPTVRKTSEMNVSIMTVHHTDGPDREFMQIIKDLEDALEADPSVGGLADQMYVSATSPLLTSEEIGEDNFIGEIIITVNYRHARAVA